MSAGLKNKTPLDLTFSFEFSSACLRPLESPRVVEAAGLNPSSNFCLGPLWALGYCDHGALKRCPNAVLFFSVSYHN